MTVLLSTSEWLGAGPFFGLANPSSIAIKDLILGSLCIFLDKFILGHSIYPSIDKSLYMHSILYNFVGAVRALCRTMAMPPVVDTLSRGGPFWIASNRVLAGIRLLKLLT